ncbi:FimV/HubP family polar landmark protein [Halomonas sp. YLGW01]|uniref:FimV/HubP family polar landmark protein n=1 Tax=Halomonas sp. YLGW01 TaxID=2773308 RepID=UPI0017846355|nr:FimV/HubP family polar landmark protein [Halomonas sp. YLGW01]
MNRKFSLLILMSLSALSSPSWSLGVGDARVSSALGAPLEATIPLTDTQGVSAKALTARLADVAAYRRAGLERSLWLEGLEMTVIPQVSGLAVKVRSRHPVSDPYLDLLVELDGPSGRQQRQVTLLFDPPGFGSQSAGAATSGAYSPEQPRRQGTVASLPPATPRETPREGGETSSRGAGYVDVGDTLWSVAERLRPGAGITMPQMMMALLGANPDAFSGGNINRLKAGHVLEVPSREQILARAPQEAKQQMQAHNRAFSRGEPLPMMASPSTPAPTGVNAPDGSTDAAAEVASGSPDGQEPTVADADVASESTARLEADTASDEAADQPRLTLLTDAEVQAEAVDTVSSEQSDRLDRMEERLEQSQQSLAAMRAEREENSAELASLREEVARLRDSLSSMAAKLASSAAQAEASWAGSGFVDRYLMPLWATLSQAGRTLSGQLAAGGLAVLLALWLLVRRRRTSNPARDEASGAGLVEGEDAAATTLQGDDKPAHGASKQGEALMPQAESVSEADIFMAYGRYEQAQAMIEEGLAAEPERYDLRLKLVKALVEQGKWQSVHAEAERLAADDDPARQSELVRLLAREPRAPSDGAGRVAEIDADQRETTPDTTASNEPGEEESRAFIDSGISLAPVESASALRPPIEREPMAFDDKPQPARPSWQEGEDVTPEEIGEALHKASVAAPEEQDAERDVPLEMGAAASAEEGDAEREREAVESRSADYDATTPVPGDGEASPESGSNVIDYRPPPLELETDTPEETPMQPSVEFASEGGQSEESSALGEEADSDLAQLLRGEGRGSRMDAFGAGDEDWEIEEVAFEPLHLDNERPADSPSESRALVGQAEARLEQGDHAQARDLLDRALEEGDGDIREQAKRMIAQHNL